jgi:hypothetical protein
MDLKTGENLIESRVLTMRYPEYPSR